MVDTRTETLESEPAASTLIGYPSRWRWLQDTATRVRSKQNIPMQQSPAVPRGI